MAGEVAYNRYIQVMGSIARPASLANSPGPSPPWPPADLA